MKRENKPILKAQVLALVENGYSYKKINELLGISTKTITDWVKQSKVNNSTIDKLKPHIEKQLELAEYELATLSAQQLKKRLKDDKKISKAKLSELTNAYKTIREIQGKGATGTQINIQINHNNNEFTISKN